MGWHRLWWSSRSCPWRHEERTSSIVCHRRWFTCIRRKTPRGTHKVDYAPVQVNRLRVQALDERRHHVSIAGVQAAVRTGVSLTRCALVSMRAPRAGRAAVLKWTQGHSPAAALTAIAHTLPDPQVVKGAFTAAAGRRSSPTERRRRSTWEMPPLNAQY